MLRAHAKEEHKKALNAALRERRLSVIDPVSKLPTNEMHPASEMTVVGLRQYVEQFGISVREDFSNPDDYVPLAAADRLLAQMQVGEHSDDVENLWAYEPIWRAVLEHLLKQADLSLLARCPDNEIVRFEPTTELQGAWVAKAELRRIFAKLSCDVVEKIEVMRQQRAEEQARQDAARCAAGRYTIREAAKAVADNTGERYSDVLDKLKAARASGALQTYEPGRNVRYMSSTVRDFYEEAYWDDLNSWLEKHEARITFRFPQPATATGQSAQDPNEGSDSWQVIARQIADECFDRDTANSCRDSLRGYAKRVMEKMQKLQIHGPRGRIDNPNTIQREALQGSKWWATKKK
ncbi:Uncharacterised protein [Burkholderia pseudomallei]|nr:Uncharacterised protein [Burkholderia pseudomallei]CAJ4275797.1 Uncharacterised protein [Burkholderia pseudomallei]